MAKLILKNHLAPTSAINLAYSKVSFLFYIFAIVDNAARETIMKSIEKKNFVIYDKEVPCETCCFTVGLGYSW